MASSEIFEAPKFGQLPPRKGNRAPDGRWLSIAAALKDRPGQWALIAITGSTTSSWISRGMRGFAPAGAYEATTRTLGKGRVELWARYVPLAVGETRAAPDDRSGGMPLLCQCGHGLNRHTKDGCGRVGCTCSRKAA